MLTLIIIAVTVVVSMYAFNQADTMRRFMMNPYLIGSRRQYYRFVTSGFIHNDHMHLIWNMVALYFLGSKTETAFLDIFEDRGWIYFMLFYLLGIIVSDIPTYFKHKHNPGYNALGASGGVSSVIFASIIIFPTDDICIYFICLPGFILGTLYLIWSYFQGKRAGDNINHDAHLYGALFGLLFCIVMHPSSIPSFFYQIANWRFFE